MATKMMAPNTGLWWVDESLIPVRDPLDIKPILANLSTAQGSPLARNFSKAVMAGYTLNPTGSDTQNAQAITDKGVGQARGAANYEGQIPFFREDDPTNNTTSVYLEAYKTFKTPGRMGYWMRRVGKTADVALAAGDVVDLFYFMSWEPRVVEDPNGGPIRFVVPFLPQGYVATNITVVDTTI